MEQLVQELKKLLPFKKTTEVGDIVLIAAKEPKMLAYALVTGIEADPARPREEWWQVSLVLLSVPMQKVTWTLRLPQFTGQEIFTMGGKGRFIQAVAAEKTTPQPLAAKPEETRKAGREKPAFTVIK